MLIGGEKMKGLKYTSLAVAALTATILASTNNGKVQAASTNENDTVTVAKSDKEKAQAAVNQAQNSVNNAQAVVDSKKSALTDAQEKAQAPDNAYSAQQAKVNDSQKNLSAKQAIAKQAQDKLNSATEISKKATPENIQKVQKNIAAQQDAIQTAKQNVSDANADLNKAQAQLATAKQKQADAQNVVNAKESAKQTADKNVAKAEADVKNSGLDEAKQDVEKVQTTLNDIKKTNANNESILTTNKSALTENNQKIATVNNKIATANQAVVDAQNNVNTKQQALADAKKALKDLQDQVAKDQASGAAGFFKSIADNKDNSESLREDAQTAYDIVSGTYKGEYVQEPDWYSQYVHLGAKNDATSIVEMQNVLPYLSTVNAARTSHNRSILGISLVDMAVAMIDADYQTNGLDHPQSLYGSENLTTDLENPVQSWMNEELVWNEMLKEHPEYANVLNLGQEGIYDFFVGHTNDYEEVGHFLNLMNSDLTTFGMGRLDDTAVSWDAGSIMVGTENPLSVEDYANAFNKYSKDVLKEDQIKT